MGAAPPGRRSRPERLAALAWFEAAGRCGSFGAAARELGTSQPAVSQRVAALEAELGTALFERRPGGAVLTPEGVRLHAAVSEGLAAIDAAVAAARSAGGGSPSLTIATDFGLATYWLAPRLDALRAAAGGGVEVRVLAAQRGTAALEAGADLGILFLVEGAEGAEADEPLFPEIAVPVASPAAAASSPLAELPLVHLVGGPAAAATAWLGWPDILPEAARAGPERRRDLGFNTYPLVIQAALLGQGAALGWLPLASDMLQRGQLVPLGPPTHRPGRGYRLVRGRPRRDDQPVRRFAAWLAAEAAATRRSDAALLADLGFPTPDSPAATRHAESGGEHASRRP
jgi:LysR family glycine cleavage system transcriptional activator